MRDDVRWILKWTIDLSNEKGVNKVLWAIKARQETYGEVGISRYEHKRFGFTEKQLRNIIQTMRNLGFLILKGKATADNGYLCNVYELWEPLKQILSWLKSWIENLNEKIVAFNSHTPITILQRFGVQVFKNWRLYSTKSKITYNRRTKAITNWKTWTHYSLFNFIKSITGNSVIELYSKINTYGL